MKLTKREIVLLVLLIVIALVFVEFRFVISPGLARYYDLVDQNNALEAEVAEININLAAAKTNQTKIDENLVNIETLSESFLPNLKADQLLVQTHNLMQRNGFLPTSYTMSPVQLATVTPATINLVDLVYQIKSLTEQFSAYDAEINDANGGTGEPYDPDATPADSGSPAINEQIEHFVINITATATYDQILQLINDLHGYNKTIIISTCDVIAASENTLGVDMTLNYYGIAKLSQTTSLDDTDFVEWSRMPYVGHASDPFYYPLPTTDGIEETTVDTSETSIEETSP